MRPTVVSRPSRGSGLLVFLGYAAISCAYFGWQVLPHPGRVFLGSSQDPLIFIWALGWWPHALLHGMNPIVTHALFAPSGFNLTWATTTPGLAFAFAPLTLLFGPVVSYNVVMVLLPAAAAWTAYRLCVYLTGSAWASLVGGYLFGFSSFMLGHERHGHLMLTGTFLLPLIALALVRFVRGELSRRGLALRLGVLLALQFSISTEASATVALALVLGLGLAFVLVADARGRVRAALGPIAVGYVLAGVLVAPLLIYAFIGFQTVDLSGAAVSGTDLLDTVVPTHVNALEGSLFPSVTNEFNPEDGLFLGLPVLLMLGLYAWRTRRAAWGRFLSAAVVLTVFITLGTELRVDGNRIVALPAKLAHRLPGLDNVHFDRFAVYVSLAAAVAVALWTAATKGRVYSRPFVLPVLAVAALVPAVWESGWTTHPARVAFFTKGLYKSCLPSGETDAVFPYGYAGDSMLWQAESGFRFSMPEGYLEAVGFGAPEISSFQKDPTVNELTYIDWGRPTMDSLLGFAARHHVGRFISVIGDGYPNARQMRSFGRVEQVGGVLVSPACGSPPLTARDLSPYEEEAQAALDRTVEYCSGGNMVGFPGAMYPTGTLGRAPRATFIEGQGLGCRPAPSGYLRHGFAPADLGVPANTYPYYSR